MIAQLAHRMGPPEAVVAIPMAHRQGTGASKRWPLVSWSARPRSGPTTSQRRRAWASDFRATRS